MTTAARDLRCERDEEAVTSGSREVPLDAKVAFLATPRAFGCMSGTIRCRETHMSWLFSTADEVYKLKKPVRFPYLDFSSLERRRVACNAELVLNRRLAPDVYKRLLPLTCRRDTLAIGGPGEVVDWLVVMQRLDEDRTLERLLMAGGLTLRQLDPLAALLTRFYRRAPRVAITPATYLERWRRSLADNRSVLLDSRLGLPAPLVRRIDRQQREFLRRHADLLSARVRRHLIVDGHGDLRPEHIWPKPPVMIIDCLEFDSRLRAIDPLDELSFLDVECRLLGAARHSAYVVRRVASSLPGGFVPPLFAFYSAYRATLRARLAIAHLLEKSPRSPEKWQPLALRYLQAANQAWQRGKP